MNCSNTRRVCAPMDTGGCGYIGGSGIEKKPVATDRLIARLSLGALQIQVLDVIRRTAECVKNGKVDQSLVAETSRLLENKDGQIGKVRIGENGSSKDGYMALIECRAHLNELINPSAGQTGAC